MDPYYLVYKARELGYYPQVILAGRAVNDYMPHHVAEMAIKGLNDAGKVIKGSKVLIMGLTYKENVPDTRESPAREMVKALQEYKVDVYGYDPLLSKEEIEGFGVKAREKLDCVILAVAHEQFKGDGEMVRAIKDCPVVLDVKGIFGVAVVARSETRPQVETLHEPERLTMDLRHSPLSAQSS